MSHFTVAVIVPADTEDWEAKVTDLMQPYDENETELDDCCDHGGESFC